MSEDLNFVMRARREKLDALAALGVAPVRLRLRANTYRERRARRGWRCRGGPGRPGRRPHRRLARARKDDVRAPRRPVGKDSALLSQGCPRAIVMRSSSISISATSSALPARSFARARGRSRYASNRSSCSRSHFGRSHSARKRWSTARSSDTRGSPIPSSGIVSVTPISPCTPRSGRSSWPARG